MHSADRTRSKRWRAGTRRNKRHPVSHLPLCDRPDVCLVHTVNRNLPTVPPMRMMLTRCERVWVDDVRAGRRHVHIRHRDGVPISGDKSARRFNAIIGLANTIQMGGSVPMIDVTFHGDPKMGHSYHVPPGSVVAAMDISDRWYPREYVGRHMAMDYDTIQYGPMQTGRSR
jgi:hypothetical protein